MKSNPEHFVKLFTCAILQSHSPAWILSPLALSCGCTWQPQASGCICAEPLEPQRTSPWDIIHLQQL